jgi:hypothetical protein
MANTIDASSKTFTSDNNDIYTANVTGNFYDYKNHVKFNVTIANIDDDYIFDNFKVNISPFGASTNDLRNKRYDVIPILNTTTNAYNTTLLPISKLWIDNNEPPYAFVNHQTYVIQYTVFFKSSIPDSNAMVKLGHIQEFTYYSNPVTLLDDFDPEDTLGVGEDIRITGLELDLSGNEIDETRPEYVTFTFQRKEKPNQTNRGNYDESYIVRLNYDASGSYILTNNTLAVYQSYYMTVDAQWALGYHTSITSDPIFVVKRPEIKTITIEPLYIRDVSENIVTIDLSGNSDLSGNLSGNLWFEFREYNTVGVNEQFPTIIATVGGIQGIAYNQANKYSFTLSDISGNASDISGNAIVHDISYNVVVKKQYDNISFDASGVSIPEYGYSYAETVAFALTEPTISNIVVEPLDISDASANIATITVDHE